MANRTLTVDDLRRIFRDSAGVEEGVDLNGDIIDKGFDELGYDSVALLEASRQIEREFGIQLGDATIQEAKTPRSLIATVNAHIADKNAAYA
jgi:act minimal PKS acyl carrier protein